MSVDFGSCPRCDRQLPLDSETCPMCDGRMGNAVIDELREKLADALKENARLETRISELHATLVKITRETPYPEEVEDNRRQVGVLTAKVGTLTHALRELVAGVESLPGQTRSHYAEPLWRARELLK